MKKLKIALSNKYLKLIKSARHSFILLLYGDSVGGYINWFFLQIRKDFKESS